MLLSTPALKSHGPRSEETADVLLAPSHVTTIKQIRINQHRLRRCCFRAMLDKEFLKAFEKLEKMDKD